MILHDIPFFGIQLAWLQKDAVRYAHLTNIMEHAGDGDVVHIITAQVIAVGALLMNSCSQQPGILSDSLQMITCLRIPVLGQAGKGFYGRQLGLLEDLG
ncbi:hypothetical protein ES703_103056 [subsurface metagenome]